MTPGGRVALVVGAALAGAWYLSRRPRRVASGTTIARYRPWLPELPINRTPEPRPRWPSLTFRLPPGYGPG